MAAYETLRAAIDSYIKANGNKEITGTVLNDILNAMVSALGANTRFAGVAVPSTNPGNPEGNVVYFASQAGTYSNFGGIVLPLGIHILVWNGTAWTSQTWFSVNSTPTQNSQNLVTSGGIFQAIVDAVGVERLRAIGAEVTSCSFNSTTKKISFFNSANSTLFQLDATAFIIDGMVSDVKIEDGNLIIKFNTDAGKQDIEIPLTEIFDPANYYTKTAIDALLTAINNKLADGCLYRGMAEPTTNPPTPTTKVFYIATKAGTYTNFGNIAVNEGITILKYDGNNWSKEQISYSDGVFDISAYNGTSYADLSAALGTNGANIPQNLRKGGMSVKFVQSSDNKYVQFRLMLSTFTTAQFGNATNWQGVDAEPISLSKNLVESSGIARNIGALLKNGTVTLTGEETSTVVIFNDILSTPIPANTKILVLTEGVGSNQPASQIALDLTGVGAAYNVSDKYHYYVYGNQITRLKAAVRATDIQSAGTVKIAIYYALISPETKDLLTRENNIQENIATIGTKQQNSETSFINGGTFGTPFSNYPQYSGWIQATTGKIVAGKHIVIPVKAGDTISVSGGNSLITAALLKSYATYNTEDTPDYCSGTSVVAISNDTYTTNAPADAKYLLIGTVVSTVDRSSYISSVKINQFDVTKGLFAIPFEKINGNTSYNATYATNNTIYKERVSARQAVPAVLRDKGLELTYNLNGNWVKEVFVGTTWSTDDNDWDVNFLPTTKTNNLFDFSLVTTGALGTDGVPNYNNQNYWLTDFIEVDPTYCTKITGNYAEFFRICLYNSSKTFQSLVTTTALRDEIDITGIKYIRLCAAISSIPLERIYDYCVHYKCDSDIVMSSIAIDKSKLSFIDSQFFTIDDVVKYATDKNAGTYTTSFVLKLKKENLGNQNMIISANAMFENDTDDAVPTIRFKYEHADVTGSIKNYIPYKSMLYTIGAKNYYEEKQWRIPAFPVDTTLHITVTIPQNVTLYIKDMQNRFSNEINRNVKAFKFDGHGNGNILEGFTKIAKVGYPTCVTIPKRTSDGVWVCFHDEAINDQLIDANGNSPRQNDPNVNAIWEMTYAQLMNYTYQADYTGNKNRVPTLEEFFLICAKTGMSPMLSLHPTPTETEYQEIKALAIKTGVLSQLELKPIAGDETVLTVPFGVFGNNIKSYILQASLVTASRGVEILQALTTVDKEKVRVGAEIYGSALTVENVEIYINAGYIVSTYSPNLTSDEYVYWMSKGVTEFTDDYNYSFGLNW